MCKYAFGQCSAKEFWSKWTMTKLGHVLYFVSMDGKRFLAGVTIKKFDVPKEVEYRER